MPSEEDYQKQKKDLENFSYGMKQAVPSEEVLKQVYNKTGQLKTVWSPTAKAYVLEGADQVAAPPPPPPAPSAAEKAITGDVKGRMQRSGLSPTGGLLEEPTAAAAPALTPEEEAEAKRKALTAISVIP
jgi:hypothetical protein